MAYEDFYYESEDGLRLYARHYLHEAPRATILCMHGLTRNSADFEDIANHLASDYRLIVAEQRGRGLSQWDPNPENYSPGVYVKDMLRLLDLLGVETVILMGTSMGGLMSVIMKAMQPERIQAAIINDIGPVVDPEGLERIKGYVGKTEPARSWDEAVSLNKAINGHAFPTLAEQDWQAFTRALYRENEDGVPVLAYDPAISKPMLEAQESAVPPDLWPMFDLLVDTPVLVIRGELSDILSTDCLVVVN